MEGHQLSLRAPERRPGSQRMCRPKSQSSGVSVVPQTTHALGFPCTGDWTRRDLSSSSRRRRRSVRTRPQSCFRFRSCSSARRRSSAAFNAGSQQWVRNVLRLSGCRRQLRMRGRAGLSGGLGLRPAALALPRCVARCPWGCSASAQNPLRRGREFDRLTDVNLQSLVVRGALAGHDPRYPELGTATPLAQVIG